MTTTTAMLSLAEVEQIRGGYDTYVTSRHPIIAELERLGVSFEDLADGLADKRGETADQFSDYLSEQGIRYNDTLALIEEFGGLAILSLAGNVAAATDSLDGATPRMHDFDTAVLGAGVSSLATADSIDTATGATMEMGDAADTSGDAITDWTQEVLTAETIARAFGVTVQEVRDALNSIPGGGGTRRVLSGGPAGRGAAGGSALGNALRSLTPEQQDIIEFWEDFYDVVLETPQQITDALNEYNRKVAAGPISQGLAEGGAGGTTVNITVEGSVLAQDDLENIVTESIHRNERRGGQ